MAPALTFLGSGDAFNALGRGHSCYLVSDGQGLCTVDFGPTALAALKRTGHDPAELDLVLLTHLHGDHFAGLPYLLIDGLYEHVRRRPLVIAGPPGTEARVRSLAQICYPDIFGKPLPFELRFVEWEAGRRQDLSGRAVLPYPAFHQELPERAFMLRLSTAGRELAFTGDTGWTDELLALCRGAALLVMECSFFESAFDRHLSHRLLTEKLRTLPVDRIALTHLGEEARAHAPELVALGRSAGKEVLIGEDLLRLEL
ncbi:MAG: MBL fold metallo-hydrolase [Deltaproteobacteria bacterium]